MVIPIGVCTPTGPQRGARNPRTLFRVRFSWASLFRWYALKNARVPPAIVLSRLRGVAKTAKLQTPPFQGGECLRLHASHEFSLALPQRGFGGLEVFPDARITRPNAQSLIEVRFRF